MESSSGSSADRILLADDDADCRAIYSAALLDAGLEVVLARDGEEAVRLAREVSPRLILMDINMPRLDGRSALRALRDSESTRNVPIVAVTAMVSLHNRGDLTADGFDAVLLKPLSPSVLLTAVRQLLATEPT
jgi:CheY-like chemotaxis protein